MQVMYSSTISKETFPVNAGHIQAYVMKWKLSRAYAG